MALADQLLPWSTVRESAGCYLTSQVLDVRILEHLLLLHLRGPHACILNNKFTSHHLHKLPLEYSVEGYVKVARIIRDTFPELPILMGGGLLTGYENP